MKKLTTNIVLFATLISIFGFAKEGPIGPRGLTNGNANVESDQLSASYQQRCTIVSCQYFQQVVHQHHYRCASVSCQVFPAIRSAESPTLL